MNGGFGRGIRNGAADSNRDRTVKYEISKLKTLFSVAVRSRNSGERKLEDNPVDYLSPIKVRRK